MIELAIATYGTTDKDTWSGHLALPLDSLTCAGMAAARISVSYFPTDYERHHVSVVTYYAMLY